MGWVLGCLGQLYVQNRGPVPPVAVIPLGTGNDLSRSFGWVKGSLFSLYILTKLITIGFHHIAVIFRVLHFLSHGKHLLNDLSTRLFLARFLV